MKVVTDIKFIPDGDILVIEVTSQDILVDDDGKIYGISPPETRITGISGLGPWTSVPTKK